MPKLVPSGSQMHPDLGTPPPGGARALGKDVPGIFPRPGPPGPRAPSQTPIPGLGGSLASVAFIPSARQLWSGGEGGGPVPQHPSTPTNPHPSVSIQPRFPGSDRLGLGSWWLSCWRLGVCALFCFGDTSLTELISTFQSLSSLSCKLDNVGHSLLL